ncbi:MAG: adenylate/guanylate cyclase domain-containing protein [Bacteroidales bacterium]
MKRSVAVLIFQFLCLLPLSLFPSAFGQQTNNLPVHISLITIGHDSVIVPSGKSLVLSKDENDIGFEIQDTLNLSIRYRLEGYDENWSEWGKRKYTGYTNLPAGSYKFVTEYQTPGGGTGKTDPIEFRVLPHWYNSSTALVIYFVLVLLIIWTSYDVLKYRFARTRYMLEQIINARTEELILEKEKTETLLSNVLPKNTADELMAKGKAAKIKYNFVTVLFSDIQGFTKIAEEMNPEVLIDELDKFFFHFDSVVEKYRIEKIKTIGDAYMCAGGIPEKNRTNPVEVILAALEMKQYMEKLKAASEISGMKYWDIRIGIHTGTVVAGVVGQKKLSYDIWGDTVNTASRMESSGEAGKINISGTTYEFVKEFFICEHRGKMPVKYKGEIDMYFVNGIIDELRNEDNGPNSQFILKMQKIKLQDVEEYVIKMYDEEAPPDLYFHNSSLARVICSQVDLLSNAEQISDEEYIVLRLAAMFLFTGYITDYDNVADASCRMAEEVLPGYGFTEADLKATRALILRSFEGKVETVSDKILADSRYDYLGRVDYVRLIERLIKEETEYGKVKDRKKWFEDQHELLAGYEYYTTTARLLRSVSAVEQMAALKEFVRESK